MEKERILIIGKPGPFRVGAFSHPPNLAEFSAVIWYPTSIQEEWQRVGGTTTAQRVKELVDWIKEGNTFVVVGAPPASFKATYIQASRQYEFDLLKSDLFKDVSFRHTSGSLIEFCGPDSLTGLYSQYERSLSYDAIISGSDLTPSNASLKTIDWRQSNGWSL